MKKVKLGALGDIFIGLTYKPEDVCEEGTIVLRSSNIQNARLDFNDIVRVKCEVKDKLFVRDGDILMCSRNGSANLVGKSALISELPERMTFGAFMTIIRTNENSYLQYFFRSPFFKRQLKSSATTTINQITRNMLADVEVTLLDENERKIIVGQLSKVELLIKKKQQELELLDNLIKSRFVELFGNPLDANKVNYIFTECVEFNPKKSEVKEMQDVEVSFVPMECVGMDGSFSIKETGLVSDYYSGYTYFRDGDVLLAKITPCFENGKVAIATDCKNGIGFGTTEFHVSRPLKGITNSIWIKYLLKNEMVHDLATINMSGSAGQKRIQTPFFNKLKVYVPPIEEQEQFADFVKQIDKLKFEVQKSLDETQVLFDSLMQKYFG